MGLFSKIGHFLGHNLSEASHVAGLIPGIGPVVGGAMRLGGGLIEGDGLGDSLKNAVVEGVGNYGLGKLAGHIPGVSNVTNAIGSKLGSVPGIGSAAQAAQGGGGGFMDSAKNFLTGNGGKNLLGLAQGANAALTQRKSNNLANDALANQQAIWDANAPLREAGRSGMLNPAQGISARIAAVPRGPNAYAPATPQLAPVAPPRLLNRGV